MSKVRFLSNPSPAELPRAADVVVIGGGPAGTAALWALARAQPGLRTVLIERASQLGAGATNASLENFRTCWPTPCLAALMARSMAVFDDADAYLGEGARDALGIKRQGYAYCAFTPAQADALRRDVAHLHAIGLAHVEFLDADAVCDRFPWLGPAVLAVKFDPIAGWLDSHALLNRFVQNAPGATVLLDVPDVAIRVEGGRVAGVRTPRGDIDAPHVVLAAGADARRIGRTAGVEVPVVVKPRQSFTTPWRHPAYPADGPCVIGASPFPHLRPEAGSGAIFGWEYGWRDRTTGASGFPEAPGPADAYKDARFPSITLALLARQFGHRPGEGFADGRYLRGIDHRAGYYVYRDATAACRAGEGGTRVPYTSQRAIVDSWPGLDGLHLNVAHGGHGIMSAPAAGEIVAAKVLGAPLPDPRYADFGLNVPWVEHDAGGLGKA